MQSSAYTIITTPPPPEGVKVKIIKDSTSIIEWDLFKGAISYNIYRFERHENNSTRASQKTIQRNWNSTIFVDNNLEKGKVYFYRITVNFLNETKFNFNNGTWDGQGSPMVEGTYRNWTRGVK